MIYHLYANGTYWKDLELDDIVTQVVHYVALPLVFEMSHFPLIPNVDDLTAKLLFEVRPLPWSDQEFTAHVETKDWRVSYCWQQNRKVLLHIPTDEAIKEMRKDCYNCDKYRTRFGKSCKDPIVRGCGKAPYKLCDDYIPCRNIKPHNLTYRGVPVLYAPNISV